MNQAFAICRRTLLNYNLKKCTRKLCTTLVLNRYIDEPEYLKFTKPQVPVYDTLDIQIRSYDFTVLEHYARHVHKIAHNMDVKVLSAWATPHQAWKVTNILPGTADKVSDEYTLNEYERNIQISELPAYCATTFFEVIQNSLPTGVTIDIHPHEEKHDEIRYIPDFELLALKKQLDELTEPDPNKKP